MAYDDQRRRRVENLRTCLANDDTIDPNDVQAAIDTLDDRERLPFDFEAHLTRQRTWSEETFGPGPRHKGVIDHIKKELREIEKSPEDLEEWIDVVILALDGAWRAGHTPQQIISQLVAKTSKNERRVWPDWRTAPTDRAIEHVRTEDEKSAKEEKIDHPSHYGGVDNVYEAIKVIEAWGLGFSLGNAVKYISRAGKKSGSPIVEDLRKALWYLQREIDNRIGS